MTRYRWALLACLLVGLAIRFGNVLVVRPTCPPRGPGEPGCYAIRNDAWYGHAQGLLIADGHWFVNPYVWYEEQREEPSAGDPPLYALFLGAASAVGIDTGTGHRLASSVVGATTIPLVAAATALVWGRRAAVAAAGLAAVHPLLWINDGMLLSESLYAPLAAATLLAGWLLWKQTDMLRAVGFGLAAGLTTLTRGEALLLYPFVLLPLLLWAPRLTWRRRAGLAGAALLAGVAVIGPWVAWINTRFREPVFLTATTGSVLSAGACDATFYGDLIGYHSHCFVWEPPPDLDESERDRVARQAATDYIRDHAHRLALVVPARIGRAWSIFRPIQTTRLDWQVEGRGRIASYAGLAAYAGLVPVAGYGLVHLRRRRVPLAPVLGMAAMITVTAAMFFGLTRYRVPADVAIVLCAAVGLDRLWVRWRRRG